jgi:hypothetical protein
MKKQVMIVLIFLFSLLIKNNSIASNVQIDSIKCKNYITKNIKGSFLLNGSKIGMWTYFNNVTPKQNNSTIDTFYVSSYRFIIERKNEIDKFIFFKDTVIDQIFGSTYPVYELIIDFKNKYVANGFEMFKFHANKNNISFSLLYFNEKITFVKFETEDNKHIYKFEKIINTKKEQHIFYYDENHVLVTYIINNEE